MFVLHTKIVNTVTSMLINNTIKSVNNDLIGIKKSSEEEHRKHELLNELANRKRWQKVDFYFTDSGATSRNNYLKHIRFFEAGLSYRQRAMMGGNRIGKTLAACVEDTYHATGLYPKWWKGKVFNRPTHGWVSGKTTKTTREILQVTLLGEYSSFGSGTIPRKCIIDTVTARGVSEAIEKIRIRHVSGGTSIIEFKSYEQGRGAFEGTAIDWVHFDEEPPIDVYNEALMRTMNTRGDTNPKGIIYCTFTPLEGMSDVVVRFLEDGVKDEYPAPFGKNTYFINITWDDVPHIGEEDKKEFYKCYPPAEMDARSKGIPQFGSGKIYPLPLEKILVERFKIPDGWGKFYGMDVGWNNTAVLMFAYNQYHDIYYIIDEYKNGRVPPIIHAENIKRNINRWEYGAIDPAAEAKGIDGVRVLDLYREYGLNLVKADNAVIAGTNRVYDYLVRGKLKVFKGLPCFEKEYEYYRRDEKGKVVKKDDHLMDAMRYAISIAPSICKTVADTQPKNIDEVLRYGYKGDVEQGAQGLAAYAAAFDIGQRRRSSWSPR